ncbi:ABC transporter substrate-binding protein [Flexivirga sp. ID2601S]|uniref:ABC transporter substrate-binding protein n=1 Tax=Flexivirga aerilata TaxID=1656889 RepID=A0A849AG92_9MICO|nr:ABC transporter substrate-binding protein [Flexivirga aerilata]NNG38281.1 ABC transporter substrate-binding protein [Flexivirga aerilata]
MSVFRARPVVSAIAITGLVAACSTGSGSDTGKTGPVKQGGTLRYALFYAPSCLDPQQAGEGPDLGVLESLTAQHPETGAVVGSLATKWTVDAKATTFTFQLRPGVTFSDGTALTASVVKQNFDTIRKLGSTASHGGAYLAALKSVDTPGPRTVVIRFTEPNAQFLQATSSSALAIQSPASLRRSAGERCGGKVIGTGPFVVDSYQPNQRIVVRKRPAYNWAPAFTAHRGPARLDKIEATIVTNDTTRTGSLLSKQFDVVSKVTPQDEPRVSSAGYVIRSRTDPGVVLSLWPNEKRPVLRDPAVRVAISKAIDRKQLVDTLYTEHYKPATSVLSSTTPGYVDLSAALRYDPQGAMRDLDAAGWKPGPDGIRRKDGRPLTVDVIFGLPQGLELVQQQLKKVGIGLTLRQLSISELQAQFASGNYDFFLGNSTRADPDILRTLFGGFTLSGADATSLRQQLRTQAATLEKAPRQRAVTAAQRGLVDQAHDIPITELAEVVGASPSVHGLAFDADASLSFYDAWLS